MTTTYTSKLSLPDLVSGNPFPFTFKIKASGTLIDLTTITSMVMRFAPKTGDVLFKTLDDVTIEAETPTIGAVELSAAETEPWNGQTVTFEMRIVGADGKPWTPYLGCTMKFVENQIDATVAAEHP